MKSESGIDPQSEPFQANRATRLRAELARESWAHEHVDLPHDEGSYFLELAPPGRHGKNMNIESAPNPKHFREFAPLAGTGKT